MEKTEFLKETSNLPVKANVMELTEQDKKFLVNCYNEIESLPLEIVEITDDKAIPDLIESRDAIKKDIKNIELIFKDGKDWLNNTKSNL